MDAVSAAAHNPVADSLTSSSSSRPAADSVSQPATMAAEVLAPQPSEASAFEENPFLETATTTTTNNRTTTTTNNATETASAAPTTTAAGAAGAATDDRPQMNNPDSQEVKPILFEDIVVKFISSVVRLDEKNNAFTCYVISVLSSADAQSEQWRIEKRYSSFVQLDEKLRKEYPQLVAKVGKLPEKSVFKRLSPAVVDARKHALQQYLQNIITHLPNWPRLAAFLGTDIKTLQPNANPRFTGQKEGFLSKRGRKLGVWKERYFVFRGGTLKYYRAGTDEDPSGELSLESASVEKLPDSESEAMRHAFLLINNGERHVYCAENDSERDDWVRVLNIHIEMMTPVWDDLPVAPSNTSSTPNNALSDDDELEDGPASPGIGSTSGRMAVKDGTMSAKIGVLSGWKLRFCELLDDGSFVFYKAERHEAEDKPVASLPIGSCVCEAVADSNDVKNALSISYGSSRYVFCAMSPEDRNAWLIAFTQVKRSEDMPDDKTGTFPPKKSKIGNVFNWNKNASLPKQAGNASTASSSKKSPPGAALQPGKSAFGKSLQDALQSGHIQNVPTVVFRCVEFVEAKALQEEGIYRLSGSKNDIRELRDRFITEGDVRLLEGNYDPNVVSGLLKEFMRELSDSVLTSDLKDEFGHTAMIEDKTARLGAIAVLIKQLPDANYALLRFMMRHLREVKLFEDVNKMSVRNLGIVFSPTLQIPAGVFSLFLSEYEKLFEQTDQTATLVEASATLDDLSIADDVTERSHTDSVMVIMDGSSEIAHSVADSEDYQQ